MQPDTFLHGSRTPWQAAPAELRTWVLDRTGPLIEEPHNCLGGMATGVAAVVRGVERSVFVKAVDMIGNPKGAAMYRAEAEIAERLPAHPQIPTLLDAGLIALPDGKWWANLLRAVPGSPPQHPWLESDLERVLAAWADVSGTLSATDWETSADLSGFFTGWRRIAEDPTDPWHRLARQWGSREAAMSEAVDGGRSAVLSHIDLRADNIVLDDATGEVAFVDWAHPGTAAPWADVALLLGDVVASGADIDSGGAIDVINIFVDNHPDTDPELAITLISALGAFLHARTREQLIPAMPHRHSWSKAASEQMLGFIEAHTR